MLVGQSTVEYLLIQAIIFTFSYLGLACLFYFYLAISIGGIPAVAHPVSIVIEVVGAIEILFYSFWFLPYRHYLHRQRAAFSSILTREQRRDFFFKVLTVIPDVELFLKLWMRGASLEDLRRENVKEWLLWALFNRDGPAGNDNEELEEYVDALADALERDIKAGWGPAKSVRLNFDKFEISHHNLLYYLTIGFLDMITTIALQVSGFTFYRQPRSFFLKSFPLRPMTLLAPKQSASPNMSYFYRSHKSTTHRPVVLIHGLGVGLLVYIPLMLMLPKDIGILAVEILPLSSRITTALPLSADLMRELGEIISQLDLQDFIFVGNSYGTFLTKLFLESQYLCERMAKIVMVDPVAVLLQLPDVAYNFTIKRPTEANELQLWWAVRTEPDIAFNLGRRFCWNDHLVWRENVLTKPTTVIIGSQDCIVNTEAIAAYIDNGTSGADNGPSTGESKLEWTRADREKWTKSLDNWTGKGLELVWLEGYDHGQGFMSPKMLPKIVKIIEKYCEKQAKPADDDIRSTRSEPQLQSDRNSNEGEENRRATIN